MVLDLNAARILVDTNVLLLFVVGADGPSSIMRHKRTRESAAADYGILVKFLRPARSFVFTPHIVAECSNLLRQTQDPPRSRLGRGFGVMIEQAVETHIPAVQVVRMESYHELGAPDAGILSLLSSSLLLLTVDLPLWAAARRAGREAMNFNHIVEGMS